MLSGLSAGSNGSNAMLWVCIGLASLAADIDADCQALIDANSNTLGLIRTIQVSFTVTPLKGAKRRPAEMSWSREGSRERIWSVGGHIDPTSDGRPRDISDLLIAGPVYKWLQNWDPKNPQSITPNKQGTVRAITGPQTNANMANLTPSHQLLFEIDFLPRRTLSELARVSTSVSCTRRVEVDSRELSVISLECPKESINPMGQRTFAIHLDPAAGYMVRKIDVHAPRVAMPNHAPFDMSYTHEVLEFKDFGDGVFVPTKIRRGSSGQWDNELSVTSLKINEPIPPETFELNWPRFAVVVHLPPVNGRNKVEVWGDDGPIGEIKGVQDYKPLEARLRKDPRYAAALGPAPGEPLPPPASMMAKLSIALGALVAIMIGLVLYRRIREQAAA